MRIRIAVFGIVWAVMAMLAPTQAWAQSRFDVMSASGVSFLPANAPSAVGDSGAITPALESAFTLETLAPRRASTTQHTLGLGGRTGGYAFGLGGMLRLWIGPKLFFDAGISHYGYNYFGYTSFGQTVVTGSILYTFFQAEQDVVHVRIYAGGGLNFSTFSYDYGSGRVRDTKVGGQGVGGVELIFKQLPRLGLGAEVGVYSSHNNFVGVSGLGGLGSGIYAIWYFK